MGVCIRFEKARTRFLRVITSNAFPFKNGNIEIQERIHVYALTVEKKEELFSVHLVIHQTLHL